MITAAKLPRRGQHLGLGHNASTQPRAGGRREAVEPNREAILDHSSLNAWIELYEHAWRTNERSLLERLFARDATYLTAPHEKPFRGFDAILNMWEPRSGADERFELSHEIVAVEGNTGVARVKVLYNDPPHEYTDIWIVRFDEEGRCVAFEEWPFWPSGQEGGWIKGPKE